MFAEVLRDGVRNLQSKRRDHDIEYAVTVRRFTTDVEARDYYLSRTSEFDHLVRSIPSLLSEKNQVWMFGEPGQPGDADRIRHVGARLVQTYERLLDWAADLRATVTPPAFQPLYAAAARLVSPALNEIEEFAERWYEHATTGRSGVLRLTINIDRELAELEPLHRELGIVARLVPSSTATHAKGAAHD